jgi:hypothetical protein
MRRRSAIEPVIGHLKEKKSIGWTRTISLTERVTQTTPSSQPPATTSDASSDEMAEAFVVPHPGNPGSTAKIRPRVKNIIFTGGWLTLADHSG